MSDHLSLMVSPDFESEVGVTVTVGVAMERDGRREKIRRKGMIMIMAFEDLMGFGLN